jgi:GT2 family glycosyltransferase
MNQGQVALSVVLVSFNARELLDGCLRSLATALTGLTYEIIVVDNASQDGAADMVAERFPGVRLLRNTENLGYPKANNQGIAAAGGTFVLLLNPDTKVPPGVLERLLDEMKCRPEAGGVAPVLRLPTGSIQVSFGRKVNVVTESVKKLFGNRWLSRRADRDKQTREVFWLGGACLLTRRAILEEAGGFDERFFLYFEDIDLCFRIRGLGWRLYLVPGAEIAHVGGASTSGLNLLGRYHYRRSQIYFYRKHGSGLSRLALKAYLGVTFCTLYLKGILGRTGDMDQRKRFFTLLREK